MPRWLRVAFFLVLLTIVNGTLAYLLTWIAPVTAGHYLSITVRAREPLFAPANWPTTDEAVWTKAHILETLDGLARIESRRPVVLMLSAPAVAADSGGVLIVPEDAAADDPTQWLRLSDVLERFKACPSKQKLLILDVAMPRRQAWNGYVRSNLAQAIAQDLEEVPDADRWVLTPGRDRDNPEIGTIFAHYVREGLLGRADGYTGERDGQVTVKELAAFVQARVARWSHIYRGHGVTPSLIGEGADFVVAVRPDALPTTPVEPTAPSAWPTRDAVLQSGAFRSSPVAFQLHQALLLNSSPANKIAAGKLDRLGEILTKNHQRMTIPRATPAHTIGDADRAFAESWRELHRQLTDARPNDAERIKKRFIDDARTRFADAELDALVFAQALADAKFDPGMIRLCDQLLHPTATTTPRTEATLRLRQLADLAMRVEVHAWPRDAVDALLRATASAGKAYAATPSLPGFAELLEQPARLRHEGEIRLWTRGYASTDDARRLLADAAEQFERLERLQHRRLACENALADALAELPWYVEALETQSSLREPWESAVQSADALGDALRMQANDGMDWNARVERLESHLLLAEKHLVALRAHQIALRALFAKDTLDALVRRCTSPDADAKTLREAEALLSTASPALSADRHAVNQAAHTLAKRLHDRVAALDKDDDENRVITAIPKSAPNADDAESRARRLLALLSLAGVPDPTLVDLRHHLERCLADDNDVLGWCELGARMHEQLTKQIQARAEHAEDPVDRERAQWLMPPWTTTPDGRYKQASPLVLARRAEVARLAVRKAEHVERSASDYRGLNFETPGILAARAYFAKAPVADKRIDVRFKLTRDVDALSEQQPYAHVWLEVTREIPAGAFGTLDLTFHRADDAWLEVAPTSATLPALTPSTEPRRLTHKIPVKVFRKDKAERTGLPAPIGFLAEARFEGRSWHQLVAVPIVPVTRELQILVSANPDEPTAVVSEIRVRPGKVKQPHFVYVKNLTNRMQQVHVEVKVGSITLFQSKQALTLDPDATRKIRFDETNATLTANMQGELSIRVLDLERKKILQERTLKVDVLSPRDYVRIAEAMYQPGFEGSGKWAVVVQSSRPVVGPAIAAQLVLPMQRIPGLIDAGSGTTHVEVPARESSPRLLFADRVRLLPSANEDGPVYLHIDGVPRAFVYRTTFRRDGTPTQPRPDERPAVRLTAPTCMMAGSKCLVDLEVDNAPLGAKLEVALGRVLANGDFVSEATRDFASAKKQRIDLETTRDALVFDAVVNDWTATFDTRSKVGARTLRAQLTDAAGTVLADASQSLIIDDSPPIAKINPIPAQVKQGSTLQMLVEAGDAESRVSEVIFFLGRPERGEIPNGAVRYKAIPVNREQTHWTVPLPIPTDRSGSMSVSVQVTNHAGMMTVDTSTFEITEREPGATGLGMIQGRVLEGPRPQPNLVVILQNDKGQEVARTRSLPDGTYRFASLTPGRYRVVCVKPESQRRAVVDAAVEPDRPTQADLALAL